MGRSKAKTLYWVWKKYNVGGWEEKLREVGVVTQEDVNGFLRLVGERDKLWRSWKLGWFVSLVLEYCYNGRFIELDVETVGGKINVGHRLDWDGVVYVNGDLSGIIGHHMNNGCIFVDGCVDGLVGSAMSGGEIYVNGNVSKCIGFCMEGGMVIVAGCVSGYVGYRIREGVIVVMGTVDRADRLKDLGDGLVVVNGFVYLGRHAR